MGDVSYECSKAVSSPVKGRRKEKRGRKVEESGVEWEVQFVEVAASG